MNFDKPERSRHCNSEQPAWKCRRYFRECHWGYPWEGAGMWWTGARRTAWL